MTDHAGTSSGGGTSPDAIVVGAGIGAAIALELARGGALSTGSGNRLRMICGCRWGP